MKRSLRTVLRDVGHRAGGGTAAQGAKDAREAGEASGPQAAGYDKLTVEEVLGHLPELRRADLASLAAHERAHQNRVALLAHIDALLDNEPWPGYDALDVDGVRFGLDGAGRDRFVTVLAYERSHKNRAGVVLAAQQKPTRRHG